MRESVLPVAEGYSNWEALRATLDEWSCAMRSFFCRRVIGLAWILAASPATGFAQDQDCVQYPHTVIQPVLYQTSRSMDVVGDHAYFAGDVVGLLVWDISDPQRPFVASTYDTPGNARDVAVQGGLAYVADLTGGLQILDVTNPAQPVFVGSLGALSAARCVAVSGTRAYVGDGSLGLAVVDVSDPAQPTLSGWTPTGGATADVVASGNMAFVADENLGLVAVDASNPAQPTLIGLAFTPGIAHRVALAGSYAFVADDSAGVTVVNVSNPYLPAVVGGVDTPGIARDIAVDGTHAFVADMAPGLQVVDVSAPASPALLFSIETTKPAESVAFSAGYAYVGGAYMTVAVDVFAASPPIVGTVVTAGPVVDIAAVGDKAYVLDDAAGLEVVRVIDGVGPQVVGSTNPPGAAVAIAVSGTHAYLITRTEFQVVDVSNPASPSLVGSVTPTGSHFLGDVAVAGNYAYIASGLSQFSGRVVVVNVTQPSAPSVVTQYSTGGFAAFIVTSGEYAYLIQGAGMGGSTLVTLRITNPSSPVQTSAIGGYFKGLDVRGGPLIVAKSNYTGAGAARFSLADPAHPVAQGSMEFYCNSVAALGSYVYTTTGESAFGMQVVDVSDPGALRISGQLDTPGPTGAIAVSSKYVFLKDGPAGVLVARRQCDNAVVDAPVISPTIRTAALRPGAPNPFRAITALVYELPRSSAARVDVYDVMGRHVRRLVDERAAAAGSHRLTWDGRDDGRRAVAAGVYFVRLQSIAGDAQQRVTLLR